jgi:hypothetical protein
MKRCLVVLAVFSCLGLGTARADEVPPSTGPRPSELETGPGTAPGAPPTAPPEATRPGGELPDAGDTGVPGKKAWPEVMYGLGVTGMFNIFPHALLAAFTEAAKNKSFNAYSWAAGLQFVRRKKLMDMTVRVMFSSYRISDGNWLGKGHDFSEMDYTEFHNMMFVFADITWTWHTRLAKQFYLAYGAGIGVGYMPGKVYTTPSTGCTRENYGDARLCQPSGLPVGSCTKDGCARSALEAHPLREREKSVPPVLPALNALIGLRYDFFRHLSMRFDTGLFLPGFWYFQLGLTAFF